jgi:hypothetical protein
MFELAPPAAAPYRKIPGVGFLQNLRFKQG